MYRVSGVRPAIAPALAAFATAPATAAVVPPPKTSESETVWRAEDAKPRGRTRDRRKRPALAIAPPFHSNSSVATFCFYKITTGDILQLSMGMVYSAQNMQSRPVCRSAAAFASHGRH
mmetsp:Transcript_11766/g.23441  ORF Transcript_11766/g.23441 Transcript_11766/m.23441 type:complete len:118 (-) Transcript_11766:381-734(-)